MVILTESGAVEILKRNVSETWKCNGFKKIFVPITQHYRFQKKDPIALNNTFKLFVSFLKDGDLISCETIAIDCFSEVAKTQFPVKTNFMGMVTCVQKCRKIRNQTQNTAQKKEDTKSS